MTRSTRSWLGPALGLVLAVSHATPAAATFYIDPAAVPSLGAAPGGGVGVLAGTTFTGGGTTVNGVIIDGVLVFTFDAIPNLSVQVSTSDVPNRAVAFLSKSDLTVGTVHFEATTRLGATPLQGPGGGPAAGGGAVGGAGGPPGGPGTLTGGTGFSGGTSDLIGGGGANSVGSAGGGGAIEIGAVGVLTVSGQILASGSAGALGFGRASGGGGGGGGGAVTLVGQSITVNGGIEARGGVGGHAGPADGGPGGGGGGGFVSLIAGSGGLAVSGSIDVTGGGGGWTATAEGGFVNAGGGHGGTVLLQSGGAVNLLGAIRVAGGPGVPPGSNGTVLVIPEPTSTRLMAVGTAALMALGWSRRNRKRA